MTPEEEEDEKWKEVFNQPHSKEEWEELYRKQEEMKRERAKQVRLRKKQNMPIAAGNLPEDVDDESSESKNGSLFCQWAQVDSNQYVATGATFKHLRAGKYAVRWHKGSPSLEFRPLDVDEIYVFPNSIAETILLESQDFWMKETKYKEHNLLHRRGFLLHGAHGHGKTSIIQVIMQDVISRDGIVLICNCEPDLTEQLMQNLHQVEPTRKLMCVFEDIDALIAGWGEDKLLAILDGENQVNHVLNIATSNHADELDYRLTNRPRRFDNVIEITAVSRAERALYFSKKLTFVDDTEKEKWLDSSDNFSFAALAEMVISVRILDRDFDKTVERLTKMMKNKAAVNNKSDVGFGGQPHGGHSR